MPNLQELPDELVRHILSSSIPGRAPQWEFQRGSVISPNLCSVLNSSMTAYLAMSRTRSALQGPSILIPTSVNLFTILPLRGPLMFDQPENDDDDIADIASSDIELFTKAIKDLKLGDKEDDWISHMRKGDLSVFAALVINITPNLEAICLVGKAENSGYDIASYHELLSLPSLKLSIVEYGDLQSTTFPSTWESGTLHMEELVFRGCGIDAAFLKKLTHACKKLRAFAFDNFDDNPRTT
ncbi:uncharacterized protein N7483_001187 [Penicillium malachiteum]|uniref:uncharacterized protein n=1 Tax=Penicillium malachiteum TaxID=1324776 RepID=UPI002547032F|nr:uncharacterized protein N7483_001187 [Penicillium malachiteum]KAJ5736062.1 hypothetical protein N7483_001187 [Penicillium malachiteum]